MKKKAILVRIPEKMHRELFYAYHRCFTTQNDFCTQAIAVKIAQVNQQAEPQETVLTGNYEADKQAMIAAGR
jgi:hypothetical protein